MKKTVTTLNNITTETINNICAEFLKTDEIRNYAKSTFQTFETSNDSRNQIISLNMLYELSKACSKQYIVILNNERNESKQASINLAYAKISCNTNLCTANIQFKVDSVLKLSCHINVTSKRAERFDVLNSDTVKVSYKKRKDNSVANTRISFKFSESIEVLKSIFAILSEKTE